MRILRSYERIAQVSHFCDCCNETIWPGQHYQGRVEIWEGGKFFVTKEHIDPACEWPPDPEEDEQLDIEEPLPLAA